MILRHEEARTAERGGKRGAGPSAFRSSRRTLTNRVECVSAFGMVVEETHTKRRPERGEPITATLLGQHCPEMVPRAKGRLRDV